MNRYLGHISETPQNESARPDQIENSAGGFVFALDKWKRLDRWLILGSEGNTYYVKEGKLTRDNVKSAAECLAEDGLRFVEHVAAVSDAGRAPKNDPAILALAMACGSPVPAVRHAALVALPRVCRIGTHLFHFAEAVQHYRKWGSGLRKAIASWYVDRSIDSLAMQVAKYQSRDGWSHRDVLRLSHAKPKTPEQNAVFRWATHGYAGLTKEVSRGRDDKRVTHGAVEGKLPELLEAFERAKRAESAKDVAQIIREHNLPRECVPTEHLNDVRVWEALLPHMGLTALVRNLGKMTSVGLLKPMSEGLKVAVAKLDDGDALRKQRVHPMQLLLALGVYLNGRGDKGSLTWDVCSGIPEAVMRAFYASFAHVEPTGKNWLIGLDVSGSMTSPLGGAGKLSVREAATAMAMVTMRTEKWHHVAAFTSAGGRWGRHSGGKDGISPLAINAEMSLDDVMKKTDNLPFGGTDCALPMLYAAGEEMPVDVFLIITDSETWAGNVHPFQALKAYRNKMARPHAKLIVMGMTSTGFTIADPTDAGMLDVCGFSSDVPAVMSSFATGAI